MNSTRMMTYSGITLVLVGWCLVAAERVSGPTPAPAPPAAAAPMPPSDGASGGASGFAPMETPAPPEGPQAGVPSLLKLDPPEWNFGRAWYAQPLETTIKITNPTDQTIENIGVRSSCGCTVPKLERNTLKPGESMPMTVKYDTKKLHEQVNQTVTIYSGEIGHPTSLTNLVVRGTVKQVLEFQPTNAVTFGQLGVSSVEAQKLTIRNVYTEKVHLRLGETHDPNFSTELREVEPGMVYELTVKTVPPLKLGRSSMILKLLTDLQTVPELEVDVTANVMPPVWVHPPSIFVNRAAQFATTREMRVQFMASDPVKITGVSCDPNTVTWAITTPPEGQRIGNLGIHTLKLTIPPGAEIPPGGVKLTVHTDVTDPKFQSVEVMIVNTPAPPPLRGVPTSGPVAGGRSIREGVTTVPPPSAGPPPPQPPPPTAN